MSVRARGFDERKKKGSYNAGGDRSIDVFFLFLMLLRPLFSFFVPLARALRLVSPYL